MAIARLSQLQDHIAAANMPTEATSSIASSLLALFSLEGETALVTGGTRGLGKGMALALAEAGADVILAQRDITNTSTSDAITSLGRKCHIYSLDLSDRNSVSSLVSRVTSDGHKISILLNCGGIQHRQPAAEFPLENWDEVLNVNLTSTFTLSRDVGAHMLSQPPRDPSTGRRGAIINIASLLSFQGGFTVPAYAASKGGVAQLTKALSNEWASKGIAVNAIAPGYIATELNTSLRADPERERSILERIPFGRWGCPDDFRGVVVWLAGRGAGYVSGEVVTVDGGWMGR